MNIALIEERFESIFNTEGAVFSSPGRINLIGEHTDYNGGFVLPAAIDKAVYVALSLRSDQKIKLYAESYQAAYETELSKIEKTAVPWANYILGVAQQLLQKGFAIQGFNLYIHGDVPLGAGLSSSAAVECATAFALNELNALGLSKMELALLSQQAEHQFAGVNCGIMDQFASVFGKEGQAILLDCQSLNYQYVPLALGEYRLVLFNTNVKHSLSESAYNQRRAQCEQGVAWVKEKYPTVSYLREVSEDMLIAYVKPKNEDVFQKCSYVVAEIERVKQAVKALHDGDLHKLGKLMLETHHGLSKYYQVSCAELDFLVEQVAGLDDVLGARMMGGGFGGCTINIVKTSEVERLTHQIGELYQQKFGIAMDAYVVTTGNGSSSFKAAL